MEDCGNKISPLKKPHRTWSDKKAAMARPLVTVAPAPHMEWTKLRREDPAPTLLLQSGPGASLSRITATPLLNATWKEQHLALAWGPSPAQLDGEQGPRERDRSYSSLNEVGRKGVSPQQSKGW